MSATPIGEPEAFEASMTAMLIYEDVNFAAEADTMLARAAHCASGSVPWTVKPWRLDALVQSARAEEALAEASDAHLIVLALSSAQPLQASLLDWLEQWAACRQVPDAALAVWHGGKPGEAPGQLLPELSRFAERHGLSFILDNSNPFVEDESAVFARELHERAVTQTSTLLSILEEPRYCSYRGFGIND